MALSHELANEAKAKGLQYTYDDIYKALSPKQTVGGNTDFNVASDLTGLLNDLGLTAKGVSPKGCELVCRSGGLMNSPHFDGGTLHMDTYNGNWHLPIGTALHFFTDVLVGNAFYGDMPFGR